MTVSVSYLWLSCSCTSTPVSPLGLKQTATIKTACDPWENVFVFVLSDYRWMLVIEWQLVWWLAALWGNWAQSRAAVDVVKAPSGPLMSAAHTACLCRLHPSGSFYREKMEFLIHIVSSPTSFLHVSEDASDPAVKRYHLFFRVLLFSPSPPPRMPLSRKSKCLSSLLNKRL